METRTSHRAIARCFGSGTCTHFATFPAILATCQYWETYLEEGFPSFSNFWQVAKISWHPAKGTPPDPPWSRSNTHLISVTKIDPEKAYFYGFPTLTFDLELQKISKLSPKPITIPKFRSVGPSAVAGDLAFSKFLLLSTHYGSYRTL